jgi:hypothetical protein
MRPILSPAISVNHKAPSGPAVMPPGLPDAGNSVMAPFGLILPILLPPAPVKPTSVNHMLPSGPTVIENGLLFAVGIENSVTGNQASS